SLFSFIHLIYENRIRTTGKKLQRESFSGKRIFPAVGFGKLLDFNGGLQISTAEKRPTARLLRIREHDRQARFLLPRVAEFKNDGAINRRCGARAQRENYFARPTRNSRFKFSTESSVDRLAGSG